MAKIPNNIASCWPSSVPVQALPVPERLQTNTLTHRSAFTGRTDVLQVTRSVDCVVRENVVAVRGLLLHPFLHVIVTPDITNCHRLRQSWDHVRCRSDQDVLEHVDVHTIRHLLLRIGPFARKKGAMWFLQQILKLGAVAHGIDGLSEHVRVMDGETILLKSFDWFTPQGNEIFDICDTWSPSRVGDGLNHARYGALYYRLTGRATVGSPALVAHGMSMTRTNVRAMLDAFSPGGKSWRSNEWVSNSLERLCDQSAITGFSEYYYYASWVLFDQVTGRNITAPPPLVRMRSDTCKRVQMRTHQCNASLRPTTAMHSKYAYVVLEDHASRARDAGPPRAPPPFLPN